jgi:hypothetical protein
VFAAHLLVEGLHIGEDLPPAPGRRKAHGLSAATDGAVAGGVAAVGAKVVAGGAEAGPAAAHARAAAAPGAQGGHLYGQVIRIAAAT